MKKYDPPFRRDHPEITLRPKANGDAYGYAVELYPINWIRTHEDAQTFRTKVANAIADDVHGADLADLRARIEKAEGIITAQLAMGDANLDHLFHPILDALKGPPA